MADFMIDAIKRLKEMSDKEFIEIASMYGLIEDADPENEDVFTFSFQQGQDESEIESYIGNWESIIPELMPWDNKPDSYAANDEEYALAA